MIGIGATTRELTPFGEWVKVALILNNSNQVELAKEIETPFQNVSRLCYGEVKKSGLTRKIIFVLAKEGEREKYLDKFSEYIKE